MTRKEFYDCTFFEFNNRLKGWEEIREANRRDQMDLGRLQLNALWSNLSWKGQRPDAFESFPMPWDPKPELPPQLSEYEQAAKNYRFKKANPGISFNSYKEGLIKKHLAQLEKEFGRIES